jgi:hypothetical protein
MGSTERTVLAARQCVRNVLADVGAEEDPSGPAARRLLGERGMRPGGDALLYGAGGVEDPEARAFAGRTGLEPLAFSNAAVGLAALPYAIHRTARDTIAEPFLGR